MELKAPLFIQRRITGLTSKSSDTEIHHKTDLFIKVKKLSASIKYYCECHLFE